LLEVKNLESGYGHLQVLWRVSLSISKGEFVSLVGPNGAGKTTLLKTIAGLLQPFGGEIAFEEKPIGGLPAWEVAKRGLSAILEELHLFGQMSVRDNLLMGAYFVKASAEVGRSMDFVFQLFPVLKDRQHQLAGTLSGGERKMLAIGRGMMSGPSMLLIDEPSSGLSPKLSVSVFDALQQLGKAGTTILMAEQNVHLSLSITNRCYVLERGRIVVQGISADLLHDPHLKEAYLV